MAGLLDANEQPQGTLSNMSPQQMGLLQAGLAMMAAPRYAPIGNGLVRGTSLGEQIAPAISQGFGAMQEMQQAQLQRKLQLQQLIINSVKAKRDEETYNNTTKMREAIGLIDPTDRNAIGKIMLQYGDPKTAVDIMKENRAGIPSGMTLGADGKTLAYMPTGNGRTYKDEMMDLAIAKEQGRANTVGPAEQTRLNIAIKGDQRADDEFKLKSTEAANKKVQPVYDATSDQWAYPPSAEYPEGYRTESPAFTKSLKAIEYIADRFKGNPDKGMESIFDKVSTGGLLGYKSHLGDVVDSEDAREYDNMREQMSTELRTIFRIPGEGTLSNFDLQRYGLQLPDRRNSRETNERIVDDLLIRAGIRKKENQNEIPASTDKPKSNYTLSPQGLMLDKEKRSQIQGIIDSGDANDIAEAKKRGLIKE